MITLDLPIANLTRVGKTTASRLKRLGIITAADLLWHLPSRYEDLSSVTKINEVKAGERVTVKGRIVLIKSRRSFRARMMVTEAQIEDDTGTLQLVWFRQPYVIKVLAAGDEIYATGVIKESLIPQMVNPLYEKTKSDPNEQIHAGRIIPLYPLTMGLSNKQLRFLIYSALPVAEHFPDQLPKVIRQKDKFPELKDALQQIHFPADWQSLELAKNRLKFEELLWLQLKILSAQRLYADKKAHKIKLNQPRLNNFIDHLPWQLTADQKIALEEILQDLNSATAMNRLLEGDVGSGKTIVALAAADQVVANGYQVAYMAPTEILARQQFETTARYLPDTEIALLTNKQKMLSSGGQTGLADKKQIIQQINQGNIKIVIGTHSLIQEAVKFKSLGLAIIDEQHRFGVDQRKVLLNNNQSDLAPHLLSMTATPIPRTLSLTLYGDLQLSIIRHKPAERKPILTKLVSDANRAKAYDWILQRIKTGEQLFVVCPLVEENDQLGVKSVLAEYEKLNQDIYPQLDIRYIHGKMTAEKKEEIIQAFRQGKFPILVASTVIEVGIDIPGATMMLIEGAERFGLSQLHQLRGRIGRNDKQAFCFLFTSEHVNNSIERLEALVKINDGFELAEIDLKLRGAGDVFGTRQSGLVDLKIAQLTDTVLIKKARNWAEKILHQPEFKSDAALQAKIKSLAKEIHWE